MSMKQLSVFLENKPGTLATLTDAIKKTDVNIRAITMSETSEFGITRMIVDDTYKVVSFLKDEGFVCSVNPVVVVKVSDEPGAIGKVARVLADNEINLEYMYASLNTRDVKDGYFVFRVSDDVKAEKVLRAAKINVVSGDLE